MSYPEIPFGELANDKSAFVDGPFGSNLKASEYSESGVPIMRLQNIRPNEYLPKDVKYISKEKAELLSRHNYKAGDLVIAKLGAVGTACIVPSDCEDGIIVADVVRFRGDRNKIDHKYLSLFLNSPEGQKRVLKLSKGTTRLRTNLTDLKKIEIPLPPLDDQKRIAHLLGKVEGLVARRKQHLQQLDDLLKSVFLEMFGDLVRNEMGWDERELGDAFKIKHGFAFKSEFFSDEGPFVLLTPGNFFEGGGFRDRGDRQKYYTGETPKEYILNKGDLLLAMTEQAPGLLGSPLIVPEKNLYLHNQRLGLIDAKEQIQTLFLFHLFNQSSVRQIIHSKATGAKVKHTSPTKLESIRVGCPPINLQNEFAAVVEKVEGLKPRYQQSLTNLENLYGALSQKAFKGELDLSRVPVPVETTSEEDDHEKHEIHEMDTAFELPAPADLAVLHSAEGLKALVDEWLNAWMVNLGDEHFLAQPFMEAARLRLWELAEDDAPGWTVAEYDELKAWVFEALERGRLTQGYEDASNCIQLKMARP